MLRSIDFKTMPYLFTDKAGTCLTVEFDGRELDGIYKQVKAMYDQEHPSAGMPIEPMEPGWYMTRDGEDLLSFDGDAWHIHVLKEHGVLIFKWNETQIPVSQILKLTDHKPLFGNKQPNRTGTHWIVFIKEDAK